MKSFVRIYNTLHEDGIEHILSLFSVFKKGGDVEYVHSDIDQCKQLDEYDIRLLAGLELGLNHVLNGEYDANLYATYEAKPHVDATVYDFTLGFVAAGDFWGFTGNHRRCCSLVPGAIYLLNNQVKHGAEPKDGVCKENRLVFATIDFPAQDMVDALRLLGLDRSSVMPFFV